MFRLLVPLIVLCALTACSPEVSEGEPASALGLDTAVVEQSPVFGGVDLNQPVRILGTEPFWALTLDDHDILLERPDAEPRHFTPSLFHVQRGQAELRSTELSIVLKAKSCSDGMSDRTYPLTAEVRIGEEALKGCAISETALNASRP